VLEHFGKAIVTSLNLEFKGVPFRNAFCTECT